MLEQSQYSTMADGHAYLKPTKRSISGDMNDIIFCVCAADGSVAGMLPKRTLRYIEMPYSTSRIASPCARLPANSGTLKILIALTESALPTHKKPVFA